MFELKDLQLPKYKSTKTVEALRIEKIAVLNPPRRHFNAYNETIVGAIITPTDKRYPPFHVSPDYLFKHEPQPGGYWLRYKDGYLSYCPAPQFEAGNERIEPK